MNNFSIMAKGVLIAMVLVDAAYAEQAPSHNWTGFYAGADAGFVFNNAQSKSQQLGFTNPSEHCNTGSDFSSFAPGMQLGYMHQFFDSLVSGIEANVTFNTNKKDKLICPCPDNPEVSDSFSFRNQMQSSVKGRLGYIQNGNKSVLLPYVTAGASFAYTGLKYKNEGGDYYSKNATKAGWLVGAGMEWAFRKNWSLRAEYSYADYGNTVKMKIPSVYGLLDPDGKARVNLNTNNILVAVNYWF